MMSLPEEGMVYVDFNATTPMAPEVICSISDALQNNWANPSSASLIGERAKKIIENARNQIAKMLNGNSSDILFTSGGTEVSY